MSVDAEQSVVGACLIDSSALDRVGDIVRPDDFTFADNRRIFEACIALASKGQEPDVTLVAEKLGAQGELLAYVGELAYRTPSSANVVAYAQLVASKARARALKQAAKQILELDDRLPTEELLDQAQALVMGVEIPGDEGVVRAGMVLPVVMDGIEERFAHPERLMGLPTGYIDLDRKLLGLKPDNLIVLAGRPSMGKTALAMNIAGHVARKTGPVLVCSLEMSSQELVQRALAAHGRVSLSKLYSGKLEDADWPRITMGMSDLNEAPLFISETPAITLTALRSRARRLKAKHGLSLVVVDYLQLMTGQGENRTQQVGSLSRGLKALAKELHVPVLALSQLNRGLENRENKRPRMSDLRESGEIEQDADVLMFLYRDEVYDPESGHAGLAELNIAKQRNGPLGLVWLSWLGEYVRFESAAVPTWPAREKSKRPMSGFSGPRRGDEA